MLSRIKIEEQEIENLKIVKKALGGASKHFKENNDKKQEKVGVIKQSISDAKQEILGNLLN